MAMSDSVQAMVDQTTQLALQAGQQAASLQLQNAVQHQQLAQLLALGGSQVAQSYRGNHLRRGSEVDAQESVAEGAVYKGEGQASFPQTGQQLDSLYHDDAVKGIADMVLAQVMAKVGQTTPPQTAGHAAQAPSGRN
jgi:hypothetical protein